MLNNAMSKRADDWLDSSAAFLRRYVPSADYWADTLAPHKPIHIPAPKGKPADITELVAKGIIPQGVVTSRGIKNKDDFARRAAYINQALKTRQISEEKAKQIAAAALRTSNMSPDKKYENTQQGHYYPSDAEVEELGRLDKSLQKGLAELREEKKLERLAYFERVARQGIRGYRKALKDKKSKKSKYAPMEGDGKGTGGIESYPVAPGVAIARDQQTGKWHPYKTLNLKKQEQGFWDRFINGEKPAKWVEAPLEEQSWWDRFLYGEKPHPMTLGQRAADERNRAEAEEVAAKAAAEKKARDTKARYDFLSSPELLALGGGALGAGAGALIAGRGNRLLGAGIGGATGVGAGLLAHYLEKKYGLVRNNLLG